MLTKNETIWVRLSTTSTSCSEMLVLLPELMIDLEVSLGRLGEVADTQSPNVHHRVGTICRLDVGGLIVGVLVIIPVAAVCEEHHGHPVNTAPDVAGYDIVHIGQPLAVRGASSGRLIEVLGEVCGA